MKILLLIAFAFIFIFCAWFRTFIFHPFKTLFYLFVDTFNYIRFRKWNNAPSGQLDCYIGLFGKGKTLSAVHKVVSLYKRYDGKMVYDSFRSEWVRQQIVVLSNVDLKIPYIKFESLMQIVDLSKGFSEFDFNNHTLTCIYVLGDEFSVQLNSRNFKSNISAPVLNSILTCRHYHMSIFYTSQRFNHVDALFRQVTQDVYSCNKFWRFMNYKVYDAYELENCTNPLNVKPKHSGCFLIRNKDYKAYDTMACVDNLSHSAVVGDMLSDSEILALREPDNFDGVANHSRKWKRNNKRSLLG